MFKKHKVTFLLIGIILLASVLRLWQLGHVPISPDWDEASYGYNAYSVIHTGKDEFGKFLPVVLRSFDDYKPALYLYLVIPFVAVLGVTTEAVRLPSALGGILTVWLTYELVKLLFKRTDLALLTAFLLAISPWHIQFSRIAFEANVGVLLNLSMVYFFIKGLKSPQLLILAAASGALSIYAYQSEKVFIPLLAFILVVLYIKVLKKIRLQYLITAFLFGIVLITPMILFLLTNNQALTRARETSIFADKEILRNSVQRLDVDTKNGDLLGRVLDNRRVFYVTKIVDGYIAHFSPNWLFISGDNPRHHAPFMGLMYLVELPFLLLGIYSFLFLPLDKRAKWLVFLWFLLAPVPASITSGVPHAVRTINFLPLFQLFTAVGILSFIGIISNFKYQISNFKFSHVKYFIFAMCLLLFIFNFLYFLNQYFVQYNYYASKDWQYGYEEAVSYVEANVDTYDKVIVTNVGPLDQSYIFFLYYLQYNPASYHKDALKNASGGFAETHIFGKYEFRPFQWDQEKSEKKRLYIGRPSDFPDTIKPLKTIQYADGSPAIKIVER
jgi:4-amino-4-deoxy-L-arabinose transferase-like glycosyltransferase